VKYSERSRWEATAKQSHKVLELGAVGTDKALCLIDDMPELCDRLVQLAVLGDKDGLHVPAAAGERPGACASARVVEQGTVSLSLPCSEGRGKVSVLDGEQTLVEWELVMQVTVRRPVAHAITKLRRSARPRRRRSCILRCLMLSH
jgi:hypothetical protein